MTLLRQRRPFPAPVAVVVLLLAAAGCSTDEPVPVCSDCEFWTQVTAGLARFPDMDPVDPRWIVYSTIEKRPNAPDANRDSDEDVWLTYFADDGNPSDSPKWQLTDDALGSGDNTAPRFSPSGTQIAFAHATGGGNFEVWRMSVTVPADPANPPVLGTPEIVVPDARDPAWESETRIVFVRDDKLFRVQVPAGPGPVVTAPLALTFNPPSFSSTETYVDRNPSFSPDGGGVFNSLGRRNTADVVMKAYEVDDSVYPPDTTEARAWVSYQPPGAQSAAYPLFVGSDTLRTPLLLRSVPVGTGGTFNLGARRDSRFLATGSNSYCDTLITIPASLQPGAVDTLKYYFRVVRGTLRISSGIGLVNTTWTRQDQRENDTATISAVGGTLTYPCLMPYVVSGGQIDPSRRETYIVAGSRGPLTDSAQVVIDPGKITTVDLFPTGQITATLQFPGAPTPLPIGRATAFVSGTSVSISSANSDLTTGELTLKSVPEATFDVAITVLGGAYRDTTITGVVVNPPDTTSLGTIVMQAAPGAHAVSSAEPPPPDAAGRPRQDAVVNAADSDRGDNPADLASLFRAAGDASAVWQVEEDPFGRPRVQINELFGSDFLIENPAVTDDLGNGLRYVAYTSNETGEWQLYVQKLQDWVPDGSPAHIPTPGSSDNLSCVRTVFHPRWVPGRGSGGLALLVVLGDCPSNGFEGLGIDDNPWAVGEIRIWQVELGPGF